MSLHRAQIYLDEEQIICLRREAERKGLAVSELIRRAVDSYFEKREKAVNWEADPLFNAIGSIKLSVTDASVNHDHYLYGMKKIGRAHV